MSRNDHAAAAPGPEVGDHPLRTFPVSPRDPHPERRQRTIVIRHGSSWQSLAVLFLSVLLLAVVMLGHDTISRLERQNRDVAGLVGTFERKVQLLESGISFDSRRRQTLLGLRDHVMRVNPRVGLGDAYRYAELAIEAGERYPAVDPLFLIAIGTVESRFDTRATSTADARGLYQIWPSTGRLLFRALGLEYDEAALFDPDKNTRAAALYLDILFSAYGDPQMVLAEYNGGPLNAGYFRAGVGPLASETRHYVPRVLDVYARLRERFDRGAEAQGELMHRDARREGKTLAGPLPAGVAAAMAASKAPAAAVPARATAPSR